MNEDIKILSKEEEEKVIGGVILKRYHDVGYISTDDVYSERRAIWASDDTKKAEIREQANKFDSTNFHACVMGICPGCGCSVSRNGAVCGKCRAQANS